MSESKYRALLAVVEWMVNYKADDHDGVSLADNDRLFEAGIAALAEPVQAEPFWYAVVSDKAPVINKAIKRNDVATEYASQCSHEDVMIIPLYLHPPAAQVATCSNCERCQESLNALDDLTEAQGKANAELVEALELIAWSNNTQWQADKARAALAKYKEGL